MIFNVTEMYFDRFQEKQDQVEGLKDKMGSIIEQLYTNIHVCKISIFVQ